jgi:hypothetical protein
MPTTTSMQQALTSKQTIASVAPPKTSTSKMSTTPILIILNTKPAREKLDVLV